MSMIEAVIVSLYFALNSIINISIFIQNKKKKRKRNEIKENIKENDK